MVGIQALQKNVNNHKKTNERLRSDEDYGKSRREKQRESAKYLTYARKELLLKDWHSKTYV